MGRAEYFFSRLGWKEEEGLCLLWEDCHMLGVLRQEGGE